MLFSCYWNETKRTSSVTSNRSFCITRWAIISSLNSGNSLLIHLLPTSSTHPSDQSPQRRRCKYQVFQLHLLLCHLEYRFICRSPYIDCCAVLEHPEVLHNIIWRDLYLKFLHFFIICFITLLASWGQGPGLFCSIWKPHKLAQCLAWSR